MCNFFFFKDWSLIFGDYLFYEFYGVIGIRFLFGFGKLYIEFFCVWKLECCSGVSVSFFLMFFNINIVKSFREYCKERYCFILVKMIFN